MFNLPGGLRVKMNNLGEENGLHIDDIPDHLLVEVASYLRKESRALWAISMGAPSGHWTTSSVVPAKCQQILTIQQENWREEWKEFDFGRFQRQNDFYSGVWNKIELSLSDDDLTAVLICIGAATNVESVYLSACHRLTGRGLIPLSGSTALRRIDISLVSRYHCFGTDVECSLELGEILPVLESILLIGNGLRHIQFPKKWRDAKHEGLSHFIARYNDMLEMTDRKCCQCFVPACKSANCCKVTTCCSSLLHCLAAPAIHEGGDRYGVQTATCYKCLKDFCHNDDGNCESEWENSFDYCPRCAKYFCNSCCTIPTVTNVTLLSRVPTAWKTYGAMLTVATKARFAGSVQRKRHSGCLAVRRLSVRDAATAVAIVAAIRVPMNMKSESLELGVNFVN